MDRSKKYGLQLRAPSNQKKPTRPPLPNALVFNNDDDDDNVERDILRQAQKNKTNKDVEELHKKALAEDPTAFDYDGVFEKTKEEQVRPLQIDRKDRESRYIAKIKEKAKQREREHEIIYERKLAKERNKDEHMFADKDKFVTGAYKRKLAEQEKWKEEERLRELREEKDDVTKKTDITDFYFSLAKNVAFGAKDADLRKPKKQPEEQVVHSPKELPVPESDSTSVPSTLVMENEDQIARNPVSKEKSHSANVKPVSETPAQDQADQPVGEEVKPNPHKKSVDAVAAAKERFLARKKAKVQ